MPNDYKWIYMSTETFKEITTKSKPEEFNALYWEDFAKNCEAYSVVSYWRAAELLKPTIRCLNMRELASAAVMARSLLELASTFIWNVDSIHNSIQKLKFESGSIVVSQGLERLIVMAIWGTRIDDPEEHIKKPNVLNVLEKISKNQNATDLYPTYEYLCEIAHPNVMGNARFWSHVERMREDGSEERVMSRSASSNTADEIVSHVLWALAWSTACVHNGFLMMRDSLLLIRKKVLEA